MSDPGHTIVHCVCCGLEYDYAKEGVVVNPPLRPGSKLGGALGAGLVGVWIE